MAPVRRQPRIGPAGDRCVAIVTADPHPRLARIERLAMERRGPGYQPRWDGFGADYVFVQWTLQGCGAVWRIGAEAAFTPVPRGCALILRTAAADWRYGTRPDQTEPWSFAYANCYGVVASEIAAVIHERHGPVIPFDPQSPAALGATALIQRHGHQAELVLDAASSQQLALSLLTPGLIARTDRHDGLVQRACLWLRRQDGSASIAAAAAACGVSREHLTRVFRSELGESPAAWLRRQRLLSDAVPMGPRLALRRGR